MFHIQDVLAQQSIEGTRYTSEQNLYVCIQRSYIGYSDLIDWLLTILSRRRHSNTITTNNVSFFSQLKRV